MTFSKVWPETLFGKSSAADADQVRLDLVFRLLYVDQQGCIFWPQPCSVTLSGFREVPFITTRGLLKLETYVEKTSDPLSCFKIFCSPP